jgi:uncharacterized protein YndB with AHSA1/START domain
VPNWNGVIDSEVLMVEPHAAPLIAGVLEGEWRWVVTWTLTPTEGGTHVRMEQSGFGPDQEGNYKGAKYGWRKFIGNLERVVGGLN